MKTDFVVSSTAARTPDGSFDIMAAHKDLMNTFPQHVSLAYDWARSAAAFRDRFPDVNEEKEEWKNTTGEAQHAATLKLSKILAGGDEHPPSSY